MNGFDWYTRHYTELTPILFDMMQRGVHVDRDEATRQYAAITTACRGLRQQLDALTGADTCTCGHSLEDHPPKEVNKYEGVLKKDGKPRKAKFIIKRACVQCAKAHAQKRQQRVTRTSRSTDVRLAQGVRQPSTSNCAMVVCEDFNASGSSLAGDADLSSQKVSAYLYRTLNLPPQRIGRQASPTTNEVALRRLLLKVNAWAESPKEQAKVARGKAKLKPWQADVASTRRVIELILDHRERAKLTMYLDPKKVDDDGRIRCHYKVNTENGRLSSSENPCGTGLNLQNLPRADKEKPWTHVRRVFVADDSQVLLAVDYAQIEDKVVKAKSGDREQLRLARLPSDQFDAHTEAAKDAYAKVRGVPRDSLTITKQERQVVKPIRHGVSYGEGDRRIQDTLLKEGVYLPTKDIAALSAAVKAPFVLSYQSRVRHEIAHRRKLVSSWGRELDFTGCRLNDETYRRGYAWWAATETPDNLHQLGMIPCFQWLRRRAMVSRIAMEIHDELVLSCAPDEVYDIMKFLKKKMTVEREYEGARLAVPVSFKVGANLMDTHEWKTWPTRGTVKEKVRELMKEQRREGKKRRAA